MVKCLHLLEERIYLISGKSVAGIKIFKKASEKRMIRSKIKDYLNDFCSLIHIELFENEFHIVLKMKERKEFKSFYKNKHKGKIKEAFFIPESTYIFGREMSNLQVSFVKSYNNKYKRKGVLMDGRYRRKLIDTAEEMEEVIKSLKSGEYRISGGIKSRDEKEGQKTDWEGESEEKVLEYWCLNNKKIDLRGCFEGPFRTSLIPPFINQKIKFFRAKHPCGPNYN